MNYGIRDQISLKLTKSFNQNFFLWAFLYNEFRAGYGSEYSCIDGIRDSFVLWGFLLDTLE